MTERTIEELTEHIKGRISYQENERDRFVEQANLRVQTYNVTIQELKELIGEGPATVPEPKAETENDEPEDGPPEE